MSALCTVSPTRDGSGAAGVYVPGGPRGPLPAGSRFASFPQEDARRRSIDASDARATVGGGEARWDGVRGKTHWRGGDTTKRWCARRREWYGIGAHFQEDVQLIARARQSRLALSEARLVVAMRSGTEQRARRSGAEGRKGEAGAKSAAKRAREGSMRAARVWRARRLERQLSGSALRGGEGERGQGGARASRDGGCHSYASGADFRGRSRRQGGIAGRGRAMGPRTIVDASAVLQNA